MNSGRFQQVLHEPARVWAVATAALLILGGMEVTRRWLGRELRRSDQALSNLRSQAEPMDQALNHFRSLQELKARDVAQFKEGFSGLAKSRKALFETGLSLQEERRLLEKQLEIMTTYLEIDPGLQRIFLMRGEQPLESYLIQFVPPRSFPEERAMIASATGQTTAPALPAVPSLVRIVSKERFAHPERGKSEQTNALLQYEPPQVGTSVRAHALGEFVIFTNSRLILHGPPLQEADHEQFPHLCLGLDLETARRLYRATFIGTKILLKPQAQP